MKSGALTALAGVVLALLPAVTHAQQAQRPKGSASPALPKATPEQSGMSATRLARIATMLAKDVDEGRLPGAVVMVARRGRVVYEGAWGFQEPAAKTPMPADAIFRLYSMTMPLVSVAALVLMEDGALQLTDPVAKHLPAFKGIRVYRGGGQIEADEPMTVHDLLRHTAGLVYGERTDIAFIKDAMTEAGLVAPGGRQFDVRGMSPDQQVQRLSRIPLAHQPGTTWEHSIASDLLGRVVEKITGKRLGEFLSERLFQPLKMTDTAFFVPADRIGRLAEPFATDPVSGKAHPLIDVTAEPANDSGGMGAVSTAIDYLRFAQMLLNGGTLEGTRVLARSTVGLMVADHLGPAVMMATKKTPGELLLETDGYTFGLGFAVRASDGIAGVPGSAGEFMWGGYAGTYFWVDPREQIAAVYMVQAPASSRASYWRLIKQLVYQAIVD